MKQRLQLALPFLLALALTYVFDLGAVELGAALGVAAFAALRLARRPVTARLGGLALGAALSFAIMAAMLAHLSGVSVLQMLTDGNSWAGTAMALLALAFGAFGIASLLFSALWRTTPADYDN